MEKKKTAFTPFIGLVVLVGIFVVVWAFLGRGRFINQNQDGTEPTVSFQAPGEDVTLQDSQQEVGAGTLSLSVKDGSSEAVVGEEVAIVVSADSAGDPITAYDIVMILPDTEFEYILTQSLNVDYDIYSAFQDGLLRITGVKDLQVTDEVAFDDLGLVEVKVVPLQAGTFNVKLLAEPGGTDDSNLVNTQTQDILGSVEDLILEVGQ